MSKTQICKEWRNKSKEFAEMPTLKLARIIYAKEGEAFANIEDVRSNLRYIEGKTGKTNRKKVVNSSFYKEGERSKNPYKLPKSDESKYKPFVLRGIRRLLVLSDIHIPFHNIDAISAAIKYAKRAKVDGILLNGDTLDFHGLSRYIRDPRKRKFAKELQAFKEFIDVLQKLFPDAKLFFKIGNHEERYLHFLWTKAGELDGVPEFDLESIIKARANEITIIGDKRIIKANGLNIIHGHEFTTGFFSPVNVARGLYLRGKTSAMQGHSHQSSEHTEPDMNSKITTTWSVGCLCELHPQYAPLNKWNHGFAIVELHPNGKYFEVINKRILNGKVL
jgi:predicted phosphodiesterase